MNMEKLLLYPINGAEIIRKSKKLKRELLARNSAMLEKKIAILSGSTIGEIKNILELYLLSYGIKAEFFLGEYACFYEDAVFENPKLEAFGPDIVYIHTSYKNIRELPDVFDDKSEIERKLMDCVSRFRHVWQALGSRYKCTVIQNNFEYAPYRLLGNNDTVMPYGLNRFINLLNETFSECAQKYSDFYINDIHYLSAWYGLDKWHDDTQWYMYKYALSVDAIPPLCSSVAKIIKAIYGKNKKAIAVDLDNTMWGGVIGDDGLSGIELGEETPRGMAYADFQKYLKQLSKTGVSLSVCSKNEELTAKEGFTHCASVLKEEDFVCFFANWDDKNINISAIAEQINILPDSIVFLDDNPAERQLVTGLLPGVDAPELNVNAPEKYIRFLDQQGYFEVTRISQDDKNRIQYYKDNAARQKELQLFADYLGYLRSLEMKAVFAPINAKNIERVVQLINKTNQFNLTTLRLTHLDVQQIVDSGGIFFCAQMTDKYGDNGIISVLAAEVMDSCAEIILWVMSCRVFKRDMELSVFDHMARKCFEKGIKTIKGTYTPTAKNQYVQNLYAELGFQKQEETNGTTKWLLRLPEDYENKCKTMEVCYDERTGL